MGWVLDSNGDDMWVDDDDFAGVVLTEPKPAVEPDAVVRRKGDSWRPVDLSVVMAEGYVAPRPTICPVEGQADLLGLFYPGRVNAVWGDSGGGKTWLTMFVVAQTLRAGKDAVLIDYEDHPSSAVSRLEQLGCSREQILSHLIYFQPQEPWGRSADERLRESLACRDVEVAVFDSTGEGMALDGIDPNRDQEVARWFQGAARVLSSIGACVILIDHVVKSQANGRNTQFASGSQRKRAAINGAGYFLDVVQAPSRERDGSFRLIVHKDRFGWRTHGDVACEVSMINGDDSSVTMTVREPATKTVEPARGFRPTWYMEQVSRFLEENDNTSSLRALRSAEYGPNKRHVGREKLDEVLDLLRDEGCVATPKGVTPIVLAKPYRQEDDPGSDKYRPI